MDGREEVRDVSRIGIHGVAMAARIADDRTLPHTTMAVLRRRQSRQQKSRVEPIQIEPPGAPDAQNVPDLAGLGRIDQAQLLVAFVQVATLASKIVRRNSEDP